jgi:hypothetical protein
LPTPSELDDWPGLDEANERLLAEKRAKEAAKKGKYPTAMALVMARTMKRIAVKYADLALARRANSLEKEALSALQKRQSALSNPRPTFTEGQGTSTTPAPDPKSLKERARLPSPSEQDSMFLDLMMKEGERLLERQEKYPTAAALVMARVMKRVAVKYADLGLARRAAFLHKEALSALQKRQSALSNSRPMNSGGQGKSLKPDKRVVAGPSNIDGGVARVVELPDGSGKIESWKPGVGWVEGGASFDEFIGSAPVSSKLARRLGIPLSEL